MSDNTITGNDPMSTTDAATELKSMTGHPLGSGKPLLVGVDGSEAAYKAVWWAANYARHSNLGLDIVVVYSLPSYAAVSFDAAYTAMGDDNAAHSDAQAILARAKAIAVEQGVTPDTFIVTGDAASVFVEMSRNYDQIVIGNRGKGGLAERMLGTTSSALPAYAYCPVVVVPFTDDDGNVIHHNSSIREVVVGSDESPWGLRALQIAADIAYGWSAHLTVLNAVPGPRSIFRTAPTAEDEDALVAAGRDVLDGRIRLLKTAHPDLDVDAKVVIGSAVETLAEEGASADLVVVGSRGRGGLTGLLLGSTSQGLIQHSGTPVYVVPKKYLDREVWLKDVSRPGAVADGVLPVTVAPAAPEDAAAIEHAIDPEDAVTTPAIDPGKIREDANIPAGAEPPEVVPVTAERPDAADAGKQPDAADGGQEPSDDGQPRFTFGVPREGKEPHVNENPSPFTFGYSPSRPAENGAADAGSTNDGATQPKD